MRYDFDNIPERRGTGALKYDALEERYGNADLIPLWVADMDFPVAPCIREAIAERVKHPVYGYTIEPKDYRPAIIDWLRDLHGVEVKPEWLTYIPGIVKGIGLVINAFLAEDEKVIIQPPVYHPFRLVPMANGRRVVYNPLIETPEGGYEMDFDNLEKVADEKCRLLILASPHNPAGHAWNRETLARLAKFCKERGILIIADEIHSEMMLWGKKHIPFYSVIPEAAECSITFAAPSKTFNIAGIVSSYAIVPDDKIREKFFGFLTANELNEPTMFAPIATIAAYRHGAEWRRQMLEYIEGNMLFVEDYCRKNLPGITMRRPDASYLIWLDCRGLGLDHDALQALFVDKAGLALNDGEMFGVQGKGFMRLNVGTSRATLQRALDQLKEALK